MMRMTPQELRMLISQEEGLKLDFKREYKLGPQPPHGTDKKLWNPFVKGQWEEFIKDILSLTNGNFGTANRTAYLIIGVGDELHEDGTRTLYDSSYLKITRRQILEKINSACSPPLKDLYVDYCKLDGTTVCVISIPPSPYVHETTRTIEPTKGKFDAQGVLRHVQNEKPYTAHTVFIRRGESIFPATAEERRKLEEERNIGIQTPYVSDSPKSRSHPRKASNKPGRKSSGKTRKEQIKDNLQGTLVDSLMSNYEIFKGGWAVQAIWGIFLTPILLLYNVNFLMLLAVALLPLLLLTIYFFVLYYMYSNYRELHTFYSDLDRTAPRREIRAILIDTNVPKNNLFDRFLGKLYLIFFLRLILPSHKRKFWS